MSDHSFDEDASLDSLTSVSPDRSGVSISGAAKVDVQGDLVGGDKVIGYSAQQVRALLAELSASYQPKPFDGRSPYVGLAPFQREDADRFFGRERLTQELVDRVKTARALYIAGPSGSGKSSLVRAGLINALSKGALPKSDRWLYEIIQPGRAPLEELARVVARWTNSLKAEDEFKASVNNQAIFHRWANIALGDQRDRRAILLVDQFEEVFTQLSSGHENERSAFIDLLTYAATVEYGRVTVIFTLRSDFISNCAGYPQLNALLSQQFLQVGTLSRDELVNAIARPALQVGLQIDPALVTQIVSDMREAPGTLPLMQFALDDLFHSQRQKDGLLALTLDDYLARGGLLKALERHADTAFAQLDSREQKLARTIFAGVIAIGHEKGDTRRTAFLNELVPVGADTAMVKGVVNKLADARLLTTDELDGKETVTLAHDALIDAWSWLRELIDENREAIELQNEIAQDAHVWEQNKRDTSYLYTGTRLTIVQTELDARKLTLSILAQTFIEASIAAHETEQRRQQHRRRQFFGGLVLALGIFAALAGWALFSQRQTLQESQINNLRRMVAQSISLRDSHFDLALLLAVEAIHLEERLSFQVPEARGNLLDTLAFKPHLVGWLRQEKSEIASLAFSPDGRTLASGSCSEVDASSRCVKGEISLWDLTTHLPIGQPFTGAFGAVRTLAFSPDGRTLASGSGDNNVILWDVISHRQLGQPLKGAPDWVNSVSFSPDGKLLAAGGCGEKAGTDCAHGEILLWSTTTYQPSGDPLRGHTKNIFSIAFSPDGKSLASGGGDKSIILWDLKTHEPLGQPLEGALDGVVSLAFSPDSKTLAAGDLHKTTTLWDVGTHQIEGQLVKGDTYDEASVAFSPDGKTLACGGCGEQVAPSCNNCEILLWDMTTRQPSGQLVTGYSGHVTSIAFGPDGKTLASAGCAERVNLECTSGEILLWDVTTSQPFGQSLKGGPGGVLSLAFSPDGRTLAAGIFMSSITIYDMSTRQVIGQLFTRYKDSVSNIVFSPDGKILASESGTTTITLWDMSSDTPIGESIYGLSFAFNPNGKTLAAGGCGQFNTRGDCQEGEVILWDVGTHEQIGQPLKGQSNWVESLAFSPDGKILASGSRDNSIMLWNISSYQPIGQPLTGYSAAGVAFSPDGKTLAAGGRNNSIILWDVNTHQPIGQLNHTTSVSGFSFSPDGKVLASASDSIILWDVSTRQTIGQLKADASSVTSVAFSPDGKSLASASDNITLWNVSVESWQERACRTASRNLTHAEWQQYAGSGDETWEEYRQNPTCPGLPVEQ